MLINISPGRSLSGVDTRLAKEKENNIIVMPRVLREGELTHLELLEGKDEGGSGEAKGEGMGILLYKLQMRAGENRLTPAMTEELQSGMDAILADLSQHPPAQPAVLLLTGTAKYFSVGLDLSAYPSQRLFENTYCRMVARLLAFPLTTIAVLNGHVIAGGFVLAMACDYRVMNEQRGFLAMNEIHLPASIPVGMTSLVQHRVSDARLARDILQEGRRFTAREMVDRGGPIDVLVAGEDELIRGAGKLAKRVAHPVAKAPFVEMIKKTCHRGPLADLLTPEGMDHFAFTRSTAMSKI